MGPVSPVSNAAMRQPLPPLWTCPECGAKFVSANMSHSCGRYTVEELFAKSEPQVYALYQSTPAWSGAAGR